MLTEIFNASNREFCVEVYHVEKWLNGNLPW